MIYNVRTQTGSIYQIDTEAMTWTRLESTEHSGRLRTDGGALSCEPEIKLGERMIILGPPITPWTYGRIILTTPVVEILVNWKEE